MRSPRECNVDGTRVNRKYPVRNLANLPFRPGPDRQHPPPRALTRRRPGHQPAFMSNAVEIFDVVDEQDVVIGQMPRPTVHQLGLRHRATHMLVFNALGELFLQQRSMLKDMWPGVWDSSASGHVDSGEDYDACAIRELGEELGLITKAPPHRWFRLLASPETGMEFCWVYRLVHEGPFTLQASEVRGGAWFKPTTIDSWIERHPEDFASAFRVLWPMARKLMD